MAEVKKVLPKWCALIEGHSSAGKSWLLSTLPGPRLIFDIEGRATRTPNGKQATMWNGEDNPMELQRSPTRTYIVDCTTSLAPLDMAMQWLKPDGPGKHPFLAAGIDSLMESQYQLIHEKFPSGPERHEWNEILVGMESQIRGLIDISLKKQNTLKVVGLIAGVIKKDGVEVYKPLLLGQITVRIPYWTDMTGFLEKTYDQKEGREVRKLWLQQRPANDLEVGDKLDIVTKTFGKDGYVKIGQEGGEPNLESFYKAIVEDS